MSSTPLGEHDSSFSGSVRSSGLGLCWVSSTTAGNIDTRGIEIIRFSASEEKNRGTWNSAKSDL